MAERLLDGEQVGAGVDEVGGHRVPEKECVDLRHNLWHLGRMRTPAHELADIKAGGNLDEQVDRLLSAGVSYPAISRLLKNEHGIDVSDETLRRWYPRVAAA